VRKLTFGMNLSWDGYIAAPGDDLGWSVPSDELFQWWSDRVEATGLALYGRNSTARGGVAICEAEWLVGLGLASPVLRHPEDLTLEHGWPTTPRPRSPKGTTGSST
jgi:hypothetical protein